MSSRWVALAKAKLPERLPLNARLLSKPAPRCPRASPQPRPGDTCRPPAGRGSGAACRPLCAATARTGVRDRGSPRCQTSRGKLDFQGPFPGEPSPGRWRPWGTGPGAGFGPSPQSAKPGQFARGPPAPQTLTLLSWAPSRNSLLGAGVGVAGQREELVGVRAGAVEGGRMGWSLMRGGPCAVPRPPPAPAYLWSRGHDGHVWRRCHPGCRGPRALPALQSELRSHGQGGWALPPALGTPQPALRATPSPRPLP